MATLDPAEYIRNQVTVTVFVKKPNWWWLKVRLWLAFQTTRLACWIGNFNPPIITDREKHLEQVMKEAALVADDHIISCERGECKVCDTFMIIRTLLKSELSEGSENESLH